MKICTSCGSPIPASNERCPTCGASVTRYTNRLIGTVLADKYLIEEPLGSGGMCDVYRARHTAIGKEVAIKVLKSELAADPKIAQRFEQEARAASRVRHPHAINVMDYGIDKSGTPFLVMELVEGETVRELLRKHGPFTIERVAGILHQACGALEVAHSVGVIHRDIKPDNIIISEYDGRDWVEVVDFGVAKIQEDVNRRASLTGANFIIGTPRYMSPEQCEEKPVDARSDIYSLGVVVYEMLTAEVPFDGGSSTRLLIAHAVETPPPLRQKRADLSPEIESVVMRALEKDPDRRPQSAMEFSREFERAAGLVEFVSAELRPGGALSRLGIPAAEQSVTPAEAVDAAGGADDEDEETVVRRRSKTQAQPVPHDNTVPDLGDFNPYNTVPEISGSYKTGYAKPRATGAQSEPAILPVESSAPESSATESSAPESSGPESYRGQPAAARPRDGRRRAMIFGAMALALVGLLAIYLISSRSSRQTGEQPAAATVNPPAENANAAPHANANTAPVARPQAPPANTQIHRVPPPSSAAPPPGEPSEETTKVDTGQIQKAVQATISGWASTLEARNLNAHMSYYAPKLHIFFLSRNIDRSTARAVIVKDLGGYRSLKFDFSNMEVRVDPSGKSAIATYDKSWNFDGDPPWVGAVKERLWLVNSGGRWRITGVRDLKPLR